MKKSWMVPFALGILAGAYVLPKLPFKLPGI